MEQMLCLQQKLENGGWGSHCRDQGNRFSPQKSRDEEKVRSILRIEPTELFAAERASRILKSYGV